VEKSEILDNLDTLHIKVYNKLKGKIFMQLESLIEDREKLEANKKIIQGILKASSNFLEEELKNIKNNVLEY
jgi:hypothetical protein